MVATDVLWVAVPRDVVTVTGADARRYLHSQVAQDVEALTVGFSRWTLVLAPNGRVDALTRVHCVSDEQFELDIEQGFGDGLRERLNRFRIRVKAELDVENRSTVAWLGRRGSGPPAPGAVVGWWNVGEWSTGDTAGRHTGDSSLRDEGTIADFEIARVAAGWPAMGSEIEPGAQIPAEVGVVAASVSLTKGCYPGQELVERMDSRGSQAPRQLRIITVEAGARAGDPIVDPEHGEPVGSLTSVAGGRALGYVRRGAMVGDEPGPPINA